jgi:hypothetical protein
MESGRARYPDEQIPELPPLTEPIPVPAIAPAPGLATAPAEATAPAASAPESSGAGNVEQIRDILFGVQMRDYERRFSNLEARLTQEAAMLRDDIRARFDALELAMRQQFNALSESLGVERDNRTGAVNKVSDDLRVLRDDAADRRALAAMFTDIARRLEGLGISHGDSHINGGSTPPLDAQ